MSFVHDIVLLTAITDEMQSGRDQPLKKLNDYLLEHHDRKFQCVDEHAGGDKGFQAAVYLVAINYLRIGDFLVLFKECKWTFPETVMLLYKGEHDEQFTVCLPDGVELHLNEEGL